MAGYIIYSLDRDKFQSFVTNPTDKQLLAFARHISEQRGSADDELDDDDMEDDDMEDDDAEEDREEADPIREWPTEPAELCDVLKERLARPDWYGDLSDAGKDVWSEAIWAFCCEEGPDGVGFRADHDGIYWTLLDLAWKRLNVEADQVLPEVALSAFGQRPYRYHPDPHAERDFDAWHPMHSMHTPDEVRKMLDELRTVAPAIEASKNQEAIHAYDAVVPILEQLVEENRMLFIQVDT
ncbi:MAG: hypothetical protein ACREHD_17110 [Pirellulales bacterium]